MRNRLFNGFQTSFVWLVFIFLALPVIAIIYLSFSPVSYFRIPPEGFSLQWYAKLLEQTHILQAFLRSLLVAILVVIITVIISLPAALGIKRLKDNVAKSVILFFLGPLLIPELVIALGLLQVYTIIGWLDTILGLVVAQTIVVIPYMTRSILTSAYAMNENLIEASTMLNANSWYTFRRVILPMLRPGILAGSILSFIIAFDQFTVSLFVVSDKSVTLPVAIYNYLNYQNDPTIAAVSTLSILLGVISVIIIDKFVNLEVIAKRN